MRIFFLTRQAALLIGIWLLSATLGVAAPNTDEPTGALATRNVPKHQELAAEAAAQYKLAHDIITEMLKKQAEGQVDKINPKDFGTSWVAILRLERMAKELEDAGETAGVDFSIRANDLRQDWGVVKEDYFQKTGFNTKVSSIYLKVKADVQRRSRALISAQKLIEQSQWQEAAKIVHEEIEELDDLGCWLSGETRLPLVPYEEMLSQIMPKLRQERSNAAEEELGELREQTTPDFAQLLSQLQQGAKDLRAGNDPTFDGQPCSGPEFLQKAGDAWKQLHLQALQSLGIDWARGLRMGEMDARPLQDLIQSQKEFAGNVVSAMAEVITADGARGNAADPAANYNQYLQALAPILSLSDNARNVETIQAALDSYAASSPALAADVQAYDAVTSDLLRWKQRLAQAQQKSLAASYPDFEQAALPSLKPLQGAAAEAAQTTSGLVGKNDTKLNEIALFSSLPASLERMKSELVGKQVTLPAAMGIVPAKKLVASRYQNRHYATFTLPAGYDEQVAALKAALLVSENVPPLTLQAAMAIAAAERGDLQSAGVTISRVYAEPLSTRMATLPAVASSLVPLGKLPEEKMSEPSLSQLLLRSDVQADWVQNQYFFVPPQP